MLSGGRKIKRWQVVLVSTLAVGITPFLVSLESLQISAFIDEWPHWPAFQWDEHLPVAGLFMLFLTIPLGLIISLIAQRVYQMYSELLEFFSGMLLVGFIAVCLDLLCVTPGLSFNTPIDYFLAAPSIFASTMVATISTYYLNAHISPPSE